MSKMTLYVTKEFDEATIPTRNHDSDAGWDVYASEDTLIPAKSTAVIPIGVRIAVGQGWYYTYNPRSSMAFKKDIVPNHHNVMDAFYTGDCAVKMRNNSPQDYVIKKGDKFCQVVVYPVPQTEIEEIPYESFLRLGDGSRGEKGWGSSGK